MQEVEKTIILFLNRITTYYFVSFIYNYMEK